MPEKQGNQNLTYLMGREARILFGGPDLHPCWFDHKLVLYILVFYNADFDYVAKCSVNGDLMQWKLNE